MRPDGRRPETAPESPYHLQTPRETKPVTPERETKPLPEPPLERKSSTDIIPQDLDGLPVPIRASDGYVNITAFLTAASKKLDKLKKWSDYDRLGSKQEFMAALARRLGMQAANGNLAEGIPSVKNPNDFNGRHLYFSSEGRYGGTWVHPILAVDVAGWTDPELEVTMKTWCHRWMTEGEAPNLGGFQIPKTMGDALRLAARQADEIEHLKDEKASLKTDNKALETENAVYKAAEDRLRNSEGAFGLKPVAGKLKIWPSL